MAKSESDRPLQGRVTPEQVNDLAKAVGTLARRTRTSRTLAVISILGLLLAVGLSVLRYFDERSDDRRDARANASRRANNTYNIAVVEYQAAANSRDNCLRINETRRSIVAGFESAAPGITKLYDEYPTNPQPFGPNPDARQQSQLTFVSAMQPAVCPEAPPAPTPPGETRQESRRG